MILQLECGRLDLGRGRVYRDDGREESLTGTEVKLLRHLADRGEAVDRDELQRAVWGYRDGVLSRTVFTTVGRVRAKIEVDPGNPAHLVTVAGAGYRLDARRAARSAPAPAVSGEAASPLIGRDEVLGAVEALLDSHRLVSILGPGGVGKTRLALELARRRGAWFVPLEGVSEVAGVPAAVAAAVGAPLAGSADPWGELAARVDLGGRPCVLDNAEHLVGLAEPLSAWIAAAPEVRLCVTSRARLGSRWEVAVWVPPLGLPVPGARLDDAPAGRLLLVHAARARPGWAPDPEDEAALAEVCRRVGGIPLALGLAAAWLRVLEPAELLEEIAEGAALRTADSDGPERHRSMERTLEASWRLLSPAAAAALEGLGAFASPFSRRAAAEVAGADLGTLGQLVDVSMVHREAGRFALHPLLRQQARARLVARPDAAEVIASHARWYLGRLVAVVESAESGARPEHAALAELGPEHADILAAWADRAAAADEEALAGAAHALYRYLDHGNRLADLQTALATAGAALSRPEQAELRVAILLLGTGAGLPAPPVGDATFGALPPTLRAAASVHAGIALLARGELAPAAASAARAAAEPVSPFLVGFAHAVLGSVRLRRGELDAARGDLLQGIELCGEGRGAGRCRVHLGEVELRAGRLEAAHDALEAALDACRRSNDRTFLALALCRFGEVVAARGGDPTAIWVEAVEEGVGSRLPRVWWATALRGLGAHRLAVPASEATFEAVVLLAAAAAGPSMDPPSLAQAALAAAEGRLAPGEHARALRDGRAAGDARLLELARQCG